MPFTISHVVAVLPLTTGRAGRVLVPGALVIGSMVPDLPYFVPPHLGTAWSHSALGPVTVDLGWGVALYALWHFVLVRPLRDLGPRWLRSRLPHRRELTARNWLSVAGSVVVGATTHVLWDTFTHPHRWGTQHVAWLSSDLGGLPWFKWFQYGSGVVGLLVLAGWVATLLYRTAPDREPTGLVLDRTRAACWVVTATVAAASVAATWLLGGLRTGSWFDEGLAVLDRLWSGEAVTQHGPHYVVEGVYLAPLPLQRPRIPIWVGGEGAPALRRAARWDGWLALATSPDSTPAISKSPERIAEMVAMIRQHRRVTTPFDVAVDGYSEAGDPTLPRAYEEAGATWWLESIHGMRGTPGEMTARVEAGPPKPKQSAG